MVNHVTAPSGQPAKSTDPVVVFADIDEAFLSNTSTDRSAHAVDILASERIALVLCSSMTRAQLELAQQELGIRQPLICESGAALLIPDDYFPFEVPRDRDLPGYHVIEFGKPYQEIVARLRRTAARLNTPVVGYSDQTVEQVAHERGLSLSHARLAKLREYDEPFRLVHPHRDAYERLWKALRASGLACISCGSAEHVGAPVNKIATANLLSNLYRRSFDTVILATLLTSAASDATPSAAHFPFLTIPSARSNLSGSPSSVRVRHDIDRALWIEAVVAVAEVARERHLRSQMGR